MSIFESFSWAKFVYSLILIGIIYLLVSELKHLWLDKKVYVGKFQFYEGGEEKPALSRAFSLQVIHAHRTLADHFATEEKLRKSADINLTENTWWPTEVSPINDPKSAISELELSIQGVNVKNLLSTLRQWVSTPNEISGVIDKSGNQIRGTVSWPKAPAVQSLYANDARQFSMNIQDDPAKVAFQVACSLIWAQASARQPNMSKVPRTDFCDWANAWIIYIDLRDKLAGISGLSNDDSTSLQQIYAFLSRRIDRGVGYPEYYRLRADVANLLPAAARTPEILLNTQKDQVQYAYLIRPQPVDLLDSTATEDNPMYSIHAEGRPALRLVNGEIKDTLSSTWEAQIKSNLANIAAAGKATGSGYIVQKGAARHYGFSGFAIAENIILTTDAGFPAGVRSPMKLDEFDTGFSFGDVANAGDDVPGNLLIEEILYTSPENHVAVLRIAGHNVAKNPPLTVDAGPQSNDQLIGRYAFTIGYPSSSRRLPPAFQSKLLKEVFGVKRMMPGRIISIDSSKVDVRTITSDMSTTAGTGGAPLVDMHTGRVLGLHIGGEWRENEGKYAFASLLAHLVPHMPANIKQYFKLN